MHLVGNMKQPWPVSCVFAVAMMASAHADVVIEIEERPIVKTEVNTKGTYRWRDILICF